ncbi:hypothetical protein M9458_035456, partial [Cirrhinus mrigala]
ITRKEQCSEVIRAAVKRLSLLCLRPHVAVALHMWNSKPRGHNDDHMLQRRGSQRLGDLRDARERREAGADPGPADPRRQPEDESGEDVTGLRQHLDRHSCHRQVLTSDLSRRVHALQHHLLVHLLLTPQRICTRTVIDWVSLPS